MRTPVAPNGEPLILKIGGRILGGWPEVRVAAADHPAGIIGRKSAIFDAAPPMGGISAGGRSKLARVMVTGWRDDAGALWTPNTIVNCQLSSPKIGTKIGGNIVGEDRVSSRASGSGPKAAILYLSRDVAEVPEAAIRWRDNE